MPALTRPIRWDLIDADYDQVIKYATAIKGGTATTEAVLSRFTRTATHPAYQAMLEIGRAQKTIFCARYLARPRPAVPAAAPRLRVPRRLRAAVLTRHRLPAFVWGWQHVR